MLAAIFSSNGNGTREDRFISVSTALLKKQLDGVHVCIQAPALVVSVESISCHSTFLSSYVVFAFFVV